MENEKEKFKALLYDEACKAIDLGWTIIPLSISCLLYTSPSPRDRTRSRMPSSA